MAKQQKDKRKRRQQQQQKKKKQKRSRRDPCWIQNCTELLPPVDDDEPSDSNRNNTTSLTLRITVAALNDGYQGLEASSCQQVDRESTEHFVAHVVAQDSNEHGEMGDLRMVDRPVYVHRLPHDPLPPAPPPLSTTSTSDRSPYPNVHNKYWSQRYRYFPLFDKGIRMTEAAWYSVTPHTIARHVAQRLLTVEWSSTSQQPTRYIMDACCGVGGNTIALALAQHDQDTVIVAVDTDRVSLDYLAHNAVHVYGIPAHRLILIHGDAVTALRCYQDGGHERDSVKATKVEEATDGTGGMKSHDNGSVKKEGQDQIKNPIETAPSDNAPVASLPNGLVGVEEASNPERQETPTQMTPYLQKEVPSNESEAISVELAEIDATRGDPEVATQDCQNAVATAEETAQGETKIPPPSMEPIPTTQPAELHDASTLPVIGGYELLPKSLDGVFLSPPWGGTDYSDLRHFTLDDITMETEHRCLLTAAVTASHRVAYYLPRNTNGLSLGSDLQRHCRLGGSVELEQLYLHHKLKALVMYVNRRIEVNACVSSPTHEETKL